MINGKKKGWYRKRGVTPVTSNLKDGLISCWELDETSGTVVNDAHGVHDGTSNNVTVNQTGKIDKAYLYNGTTDYVSVPDSNDFSFTDGVNDKAFSISVWAKFNSFTGVNSYLVNKWGSTPSREYLFFYNQSDASLKFRVYTADGLNYLETVLPISTPSMVINTWYNILSTYDGSENAIGMNMYVDAVLHPQTRTESGVYTGMTNGNSNLFLGNFAESTTAYIHGNLDQTAIWNRELTQADVDELYNSGSGLAYTGWTSSLDLDAQAFIDATGITDETQKTAIDNLVIGLKADGLWSKMKAIYPMVGGTADTHKYNLVDPQDTDGAFRLDFNGGVTHSATGANPDGSTGYADTHLDVSTLTEDFTHLSYYSRVDIVKNDAAEMACAISTESKIFDLQLRRNGNMITDQYSTTDRLQVSTPNSKGFAIGSRISTTDVRLYKDGSQIAIDTSVSNSLLPNVNMYLFAYNKDLSPASLFSNRECAFASIGDGLTDTEASNLYTRVQAYQTELSRQV